LIKLGPQSGDSKVSPISQISDLRRQIVETARESWIRKLIDLSRRNNLLYYRPLKTGTLDLSAAPAEKLRELLSDESVPANKLAPDIDGEVLVKILRDIWRRALENSEEKGLSTLFLTFGMATWPALDGGRPPEAPVLLLPIVLAKREGTNSYHLSCAGNFQLNLVLLHVLENQFKVKLRPDELLSRFAGDIEDGTAFNVGGVCEEIQSHMVETKGFEIEMKVILGNFTFQKMAMVKDMQECADDLATHDVIAAIAGDSGAKSAINASQADPDPKEFDRTAPDSEFAVLDADSSQQCAIASVLAGHSRVIHGPPGTGKSQTITNLITSLAATGRRVLFVAEKKAALEVVKRRLDGVGLGHLAIDLHGADLSSKKVMQQVAHTLEVVRSSFLVDCQNVHAQLVDRRTRLNSHVERMHCLRAPTQQSVYEMQGQLLNLERLVTSSVRWRDQELSRLTPNVSQEVMDLLNEAGGLATLFLRTDPSPWTGAILGNGVAIQKALDCVERIQTETLPSFLASVDEVAEQTGINRPSSFAAANELEGLLAATQRTLLHYSPEIYQQDLEAALRDLAPGRNGGMSAAWAFLTNSVYRRARKLVLASRNEKVGVAQLCSEISAALSELRRWRTAVQGKSFPRSLKDEAKHVRNLKKLPDDVNVLAQVLPSKRLERMSIDELTVVIGTLANDRRTPLQIPKLTQIESALEKVGVGKLVVEIRTGQPVANCWSKTFEHAWLASTLESISQHDPEIRGFIGSTHNRYVDEFARLDEKRIALATDRVRRAHGEWAIAAMNANPPGEQMIRAEAGKIRRHLPLRKVFAEAADVLTAVCPCWMASPLSVSQLLDSGRRYFDFVIFDEASQVLPEDAIPSLLRGEKLVVAGDSKQLPPTTFFAAADDDESAADEDASGTEGFESLLDTMNSFLNGSYLDWHYRSQDETLINFSNHYIYQDRLVTFPGPGGPPAISHVEVEEELGVDGQEESASAEVQACVSLVLEHARKAPQLSLGVITMGIRHMNRVQTGLDHALEQHPELSTFFDPSKRERFFVKNLERVQGDERDSIIISIGYGKDRSGNLPLRFGPLLPEGGRRRLNVAVTRARQKLVIVSSFSYLDLDLAKVRPGSGVEMLRNYLQYADSNGKRLGDADVTGEPLNAFEAEVFDSLSATGMTLIPQMGASRFRIDMVAEHPDKPGRYVLAIECDGASYHSSYTARDRDRLRQQQLQNLGWRFFRIWSTDWFMRKEDEIKRAKKAFEEAVEFADKLDLRGERSDNHEGKGISVEYPSATPRRGPKPLIPTHTAITHYSEAELDQLLAWIASDGQLRTDEQVIEETVATLGFSRRGARIESVIQAAIDRCRARAAQSV
jgi:very-short-patch-repair endonuclease